MIKTSVAKIPQLFRGGGKLKILGARRVTRSTFHTGDPEVLGVTIKILATRATSHSGFVYCRTELSPIFVYVPALYYD